MYRRICLAAAAVVLTPCAAHAGDPTPGVTGSADSDSFVMDAYKEEQRAPQAATVVATVSPPEDVLEPRGAACDNAVTFGGSITDAVFCPRAEPGESEDSAPGPAAIRRAFTRLPLPLPEVVIEPPDGLTLVNLDTNVHTPTRTPIRHTVTLLGRQITIEATPTEYAWTFGDGGTLTTTDPGAPYPDLRTTHAYRRTGTYAVTLATTWTGRYRLTAGPWQPIDATVTTTSPARQLRVIEATPRLVGH